MHNHLAGFTLLALVVMGCDSGTAPTGEFDAGPPPRGDPVLHEVIVQDVDLCEFAFLDSTDCEGAFSLHATEYTDGRVAGEWKSIWHNDFPAPVSVQIDCLRVVGNKAWVSGVVTHPAAYEGLSAITMVEDRPDRIAYTQDAAGKTCRDRPDLSLVYVYEDKVTVR